MTGDEFARSGHLYQFDLQILGTGSLFALLCTTRSQAGAARLAAFLLDSVDMKEILARQESVRELRDAIALREEIAVIGKYQFQDCNPDILDDWLDSPILKVNSLIPKILLASSSVVILLALSSFIGMVSLIYAAPILLALMASQLIISILLIRQIRAHVEILCRLTNEFSVLRRGLDSLQRQNFKSTKLKALVDRVRETDPSHRLPRLERLLEAVEQREKALFFLPSHLLAAGTQLVLAIERWRVKYNDQLRIWIDCWAEFEALSAVSCYAYEHPTDAFPEFVSDEAVFEANDLGHPLLPCDTCIRNDVALNESARFYIISGSNMAGKSTFLKAIGINAVLAYAGAPVRASHARFSPLAICASNSITDSLLEGRSKFLAEAERLREAVRMTSGRKPVLFLIDEILSGTNSQDRRIACESIVRALINRGAIGMLSTHDLTLTEIANLPELGGANCHMEGDDPRDPLNFDYKVKEGLARRSNALGILRLMGFDQP